ncbi:hypothetical protein [Spirulina sp. 06S082]|uniref:hypothetical protein n=1 Tax=Spirulina sp. 06S082 TaxID=3110248 RepID=UPI002B2074CC|nr:hypothetical protein [Spirulina sp. 06S082]MEA5472213.1 hypothetical protein [Spirulina sp. 06S082]
MNQKYFLDRKSNMNQNKLDKKWIDLYAKFFRREAHQLLAWGYQDALPKIEPNSEEEAITGSIVEAMKNRMSMDDKFDPYFVDEERPILGEGRKGKHRRRLDIVVQFSNSQPRLEYIFEAKRLRTNGFAIGKYTGEEGLQCFINGIYASEFPEAAMIAYIQSDDCDRWEKELKGKFDKDSENILKIKQKLQRVIVIEDIPDEWLSEHERATGKPILIYHIFLDCCCL